MAGIIDDEKRALVIVFENEIGQMLRHFNLREPFPYSHFLDDKIIKTLKNVIEGIHLQGSMLVHE